MILEKNGKNVRSNLSDPKRGGDILGAGFFFAQNLAPKASFLENISVFHGKSELLVQVSHKDAKKGVFRRHPPIISNWGLYPPTNFYHFYRFFQNFRRIMGGGTTPFMPPQFTHGGHVHPCAPPSLRVWWGG